MWRNKCIQETTGRTGKRVLNNFVRDDVKRSAHGTGNGLRRQNVGRVDVPFRVGRFFSLLASAITKLGVCDGRAPTGASAGFRPKRTAHVSWSTRTRHACRRVNYIPELRRFELFSVVVLFSAWRNAVNVSDRHRLRGTRANVAPGTRHSDGRDRMESPAWFTCHHWLGGPPTMPHNYIKRAADAQRKSVLPKPTSLYAICALPVTPMVRIGDFWRLDGGDHPDVERRRFKPLSMV